MTPFEALALKEPVQAEEVTDIATPLQEATPRQASQYVDDMRLDIERPGERDIMMDAYLAELSDFFETRKRYDMTYAGDPYVTGFHAPATQVLPYHADGYSEFDEGTVVDAFSRYVPDEPPFQLPNPAGVTPLPFTPGAVPANQQTFGPLQRELQPGFDQLARTGYSEPVADPTGDLLRNSLRRIVRAV